MTRYADTSFLVSLVFPDANHAAARAALAGLSGPADFAVVQFGEFEFRNTLRMLVARGAQPPDIATAVRLYGQHKTAGAWTFRPLALADWMGEAEKLSTRFTPTIGTRAMDVLHVAAARLLGAREFFTFDRNQTGLARAAGLIVRP